MKVVVIVTNVLHLNVLTLFVVCHFLNARISPEWRLNPGFGTPKRCRFPLNQGVPSIEETGQGVPRERFHGRMEWTGNLLGFFCPLLSFEHDGFVPGGYPAAKGQLLYVPF